MTSMKRVIILIFLNWNAVSVYSYKYRPITDSDRVCLATYKERLDNEALIGHWYFVYHFTSMFGLVPSTECVEAIFERPTQQEFAEYVTRYNLTGMPYTFDEDSVMYRETWGDYHTGLIIGKREAKFYLKRPRNYTNPEVYDIIAFKPINNDYIVHIDCMLGGNSKWLLSKQKHQSKNELLKIIETQKDLREMDKQKFCEVRPE